MRIVALLVLLPSIALAHGRPTEVQRIAFDPNDPDRIVLQTTFGLVAAVTVQALNATARDEADDR